MYFKKLLLLVCILTFGMAHAFDDGSKPNLGKKLTIHEVKSLSTTVFIDGKGLPKGNGNAKIGKEIYTVQCLACHGDKGQGGVGPKLAGKPDKGTNWSTGAAWPYTTSIFDYTRRAMPPTSVKQLSSDEVYSLTAYILYMNNIVGFNEEMNAKTLPKVKMPAVEYMSSKWEKEEKSLFKMEAEN